MNKNILVTILVLVVLIIFFIGYGIKRTPQPFRAFSANPSEPETFQLPGDLPQPVDRFYREVYGEEIPLIRSFILDGRGQVRFMGVTMPARLRFIHDAGKGYRHYIETTFWGLPVMKVNEYYLDGRSRLALPFGVIENEPQVDEAANLGMWSETMMFPGVFLSTEGVRWEPLDKDTATLFVPFGSSEDALKVYFDPTTGLIDKMETMRWKNAGDQDKTRWQAQVIEWGTIKGWKMPVKFAAQWMDEDSPWLIADIEDVVWNVNVSDYIRQEGL